jgi:PAS domain S-box-containing protein
MRAMMNFFSRLACLIGEMGLGRKSLDETNTELRKHQEHLEKLVRGRTTELTIAKEQAEMASQALRESEERFRSLIMNSSDVTTVLSADGIASYHSPALKRILGYEPEQFIGMNGFDYVHPDDLEAAKEKFLFVVEHPNVTVSIEYRFRRADGSWAYLESIASNHLDDPAIQGIILNSRDITERKRMEGAL